MKMTMNLSYYEGLELVEALRDVALENGWDEDELEESGVIEEYSKVVDAALEAMGIEVSIDSQPKDEDEDEDDYEYENEYDDDDYEDEDEDELTEAEQLLAMVVFSKVQELLPHLSVENQAEVAARITARIIADVEEDGE